MDHELVGMGSRIEEEVIVYPWGTSKAYDATCLCRWYSDPYQSLRTAVNELYNHIDRATKYKE